MLGLRLKPPVNDVLLPPELLRGRILGLFPEDLLLETAAVVAGSVVRRSRHLKFRVTIRVRG